MNSFSFADELDQAVDQLLASPDSEPMHVDLEMGELLGIAAELLFLPQADFKLQLQAELTGQKPQPTTSPRFPVRTVAETPAAILPTLTGTGVEGYPMHQRSLAASVVMHATALALLVVSGVWAARPPMLKPSVTMRMISLGDYPLPPAPDKTRGGGGGGDRDPLRASTGAPPRFSPEQLAPPQVVIKNQYPKLPVEPTVIGPPNVTFPKMQMGDLMSKLETPSNGTGIGGGIGDTRGTGVGSGIGPGVGPGSGGGIGGGPYIVGGGVSAPRPIYDPEPEYSEEARKAKYQGDVVLWVVIGPDGRTRDVRVQRSLGMGLDEKAMETVRSWRFEPATKDGQPVAVQVNIEVAFRLF
jgi:protein TonB